MLLICVALPFSFLPCSVLFRLVKCENNAAIKSQIRFFEFIVNLGLLRVSCARILFSIFLRTSVNVGPLFTDVFMCDALSVRWHVLRTVASIAITWFYSTSDRGELIFRKVSFDAVVKNIGTSSGDHRRTYSH